VDPPWNIDGSAKAKVYRSCGLQIVRIGAVMVGYASMKCFFINRYMRKNDEMET